MLAVVTVGGFVLQVAASVLIESAIKGMSQFHRGFISFGGRHFSVEDPRAFALEPYLNC